MTDALPAEAGAAHLPPGYRIVARSAVGSTNDEAKVLAFAGADAGTVVWAQRQDSGRGRRGRAWSSPEGNLYTSTILRPGRPAAVVAQLSFVAALAIADTAAEVLPPGAEIRCKWPNDVLVRGRKVSGILLECEAEAGGGVEWVVLGVGVNLRHHPHLSEGMATALVAEGAVDEGVVALLERYVRHLAAWYGRWLAGGFAAIRPAWLERAVGIGAPVVVRLADRTLTGVFADLDSDGVLLLDRDDGGVRQRIAAGDVFFAPRAEA